MAPTLDFVLIVETFWCVSPILLVKAQALPWPTWGPEDLTNYARTDPPKTVWGPHFGILSQGSKDAAKIGMKGYQEDTLSATQAGAQALSNAPPYLE